MARWRTLRLYALALLAAGCTVGPDYTRPDVSTPSVYRGADPVAPAAGGESFGDLAWDSVFVDPDLQALIRTALEQNYDVRVAAERVLQAESLYTGVRSRQFPTVDAAATVPYTGYSGSDSDRPAEFTDYRFDPAAGIGLAWELDFWGRFRRDTESAQAELLAVEEARYAVIATLVAEVGRAYVTLRALDATLEISRRTVTSREKSLDLVQARLDGGVAGVLDVRQAETLLYTATGTIPEIERQIEETENFINILLGQNPGPVKRGRPLEQQLAAPALPPGLPMELLTRRPDIRAAEQQLVSANAQIGVAKALLYPQVTLSGFAGAGRANIDGDSFGWFGTFNALGDVTQPLFNAGRLRANVEFNEANARAASLQFQQVYQQALRDVSDALVGIRKRQEFRQQQELLVTALADASDVANLRYEGGVSSYLEVLDTERQLFDAEQELIRAKRNEFLSVIQLYRALGGGWEAEPSAMVAADTQAAGAQTAGMQPAGAEPPAQ